MIVDSLKAAPAPFTGAEIHVLSNGFRILLLPDKKIPAVAMQYWSRCGAIDEEPRVYGISHGLEHMVFKGTPTRSAREISRLIEGQGGNINAATQLETTHYYLEVPPAGAGKALDILTDTLLNPTFPQDELDRERQVILEEIRRRDDSPEATMWDEFSSHLFKNTPYAIRVIGSPESVSAITRDDLHRYFQAHYLPEKMTFVAAGDFDKSAFLQTVKSAFESRPKMKAPDEPVVHLSDWKPMTQEIRRPVELTYIAAGFPTVGLTDPDSTALDLLASILAGGISSRFYQSIREDKQSALAVSCDYIPFRQKGIFGFFLDALPHKAEAALNDLRHEIAGLEKFPIRPDELERAKIRTKTDWIMGSETPRGQASTLGNLSVLGQLDLINRYLPAVDAMTVDGINAIAKKYLANREFSVTKIIPNS